MCKVYISVSLAALLIFGPLFSYSQSIGEDEAKTVAKLFFEINLKDFHNKSAINCVYTESMDSKALFYVFNAEKAFVIVSADKRVIPVLAYSLDGNFNTEEIIPPVKMWLDSYKKQINAAKQNNLPQCKLWTINENINQKNKGVKPMLNSKWGQGNQFNYYCPKDENAGNNRRAVTGCVATAMGQLMYYFRWPETGKGKYSYEHDTYGNISADFENTRYVYDNMCDAPSQINAAASTLIHHCGVSVDMVYGPKSSGMYNHKAAFAMRTYFKYSPTTQYLFRDSNNMVHDSLHPEGRNLNWDSLIVSHLEKGIPLYYAGWSIPWTDGHGFVCDGYQCDASENYYFHFNFGWEGNSDGYFYTGKLNPSVYNFNLAQEMIVNAYPDTANYIYPVPKVIKGKKTLTHASGSFHNGAEPNHHCDNNMDFTWSIRPGIDTIIEMNLYVECRKIAESDTVYITSPNKSFKSIVLTDIDTSISSSFPYDEFDIRLVSGNQSKSEGLYVSYEVIYPEFCNTTRLWTKTTETVTDKSDIYNYNNNACCGAIIRVKNYAGLSIYFNQFKTEEKYDVLSFYDLNDENRLILSLSGNFTDSTFFLHTNSVLLEFTTNDSVTDEGWSLRYNASKAEIEENTTGLKAFIYPNPAENQINIFINKKGNSEIDINDCTGRIFKHTFTSECETFIDISDLSAGLYFIRIRNENGRFIKKFIKQ